MTAMPSQVQTAADQAHANLVARGYTTVDHTGPLNVGTRIRHIGHQWPAALRNGTGVVHALAKGGPDDIELVVVWDKPGPTGSYVADLADYHVVAIQPRSVES
ncbi:hypothetical protein [Glycomyces sp. YM15]|uniref:hypothetical protein n=1 Tax=Glycomyces sp. YM15 TaxID=2800446 RepID=UPI0019641781|nr:hypothetical protein [Glycomyces sp. YM15]